MAINWVPSTMERYDDMLGVLPPAAMGAEGSFLVGEPMDFRDGAQTFAAHKILNGQPVESAEAVTYREFKADVGKAEWYGV